MAGFGKFSPTKYGFLLMRLPKDFAFVETARARNERILVDALHFGGEAMHQLTLRTRQTPKVPSLLMETQNQTRRWKAGRTLSRREKPCPSIDVPNAMW